jgi:mono/diheme cytochrome c family protein
MAPTTQPSRTVLGAATLLLVALAVPSLGAQQRTGPARTGDQVYRAGCAACHGADGKGAPQSLVGFDAPLPDFTDCSFATREPAADWFAISHAGGPVRAFDRRMPAFGDALTEAEIERTLEHIATFCGDRAWPRGELNLPRPLVTEKAYPEDEAVLTSTFGTGDDKALSNQFLYERRFGARNQFEVLVPLAAHRAADGAWQSGLGDVAVAVKRVLAHSLQRGSILSVTGEVVFPTGKETQGLGKGTTVFEPFVTFGQLLPRNAFVHAQVGAEIPANDGFASEGFWRAAIGQTFEQGRFGRAWSPIVELLGARELESGARTRWDIVPQMQITLSKRQHIMINGGIRIPLTARDGRHAQVITYFLWDWFDGGLLDGWR